MWWNSRSQSRFGQALAAGIYLVPKYRPAGIEDNDGA